MSGTTPSQTVGPFFGQGLPYEDGPRIAPEWHPDTITVHGAVFDGAGEPVPDAMVEIWQAGPDGVVSTVPGSIRRANHGFNGFGRCDTDPAGGYWFSTVKPGGPVPYLAMLVFSRGLLKPVSTRVYFPEDAGAHETCSLFTSAPVERRSTLVAVAEGERAYRFDVHLQGDDETVFFAI
jgi:protocatechuate 3,4-dioxygenase alpha subunit